MEEREILRKIIEDKFDRFRSSDVMMVSDFLTMEEISSFSHFLRSFEKEGALLFGGYDEAERKMIVFTPEYLGVHDEAGLLEYFKENPEECPIKILECTVPKQEKVDLSHRDYLGALMGLGIKREKIGDIIVKDKKAQIIVMNEMAEYLKTNLSQVGRANITTELKELSFVEIPKANTVDEKLSVASPRLDNVVSEAFKVSRKIAKEAILKGIVFIDGVQVSKPDFSLKGGEKIVLRGKGKVIFKGTCGTSRKGNSYIEITKYL